MRLNLINSVAPVPPQASAAGFSSLVFNADFNADGLGILDVNDTGDPGYKLFVRSAWSTASDAGINSFWENVITPDPSYYSLADGYDGVSHCMRNAGGSINPGDGGSQIIATTAIYKATAPGYQGFLFGPGGYIECKMSYVTGEQFTNSMAFYGNPVEWWSADYGDPATVFTEVDVMELSDFNFQGNGYNSAHADALWWNPYNSSSDPDFSARKDLPEPNADPLEELTFYTYGWLWKTRAMNDGTGLLEFYINNVLKASITYEATGPRSEMDDMHYVMNIVRYAGQWTDVAHIRAWA